MTFDQVNPKTGKVKEYQNSAEWLKDVEEATAKPQEKKPEVKTYADAARRLNEELGIRDPVAEKAAADAELIERKVAEGISAALAKQQAQVQTANQTPKPTPQAHSARDQPPAHFDIVGKCIWRALHAPKTEQKGCGCKAHKPAGQTVIHSGRAIGPVMSAQLVTRPEVVRNGTVYQLYRVRRPQVP